MINPKVFFWVEERRLESLVHARAYRNERHLVCVIDTAKLLERHVARVTLSPMNSGAPGQCRTLAGVTHFCHPASTPLKIACDEAFNQ
jgi:hypothetical protein